MAQLGIVTYNIAKDWDLPTILSRLEKLGYEGVELRTTHAHKVEVNLSKQDREDVRKPAPELDPYPHVPVVPPLRHRAEPPTSCVVCARSSRAEMFFAFVQFRGARDFVLVADRFEFALHTDELGTLILAVLHQPVGVFPRIMPQHSVGLAPTEHILVRRLVDGRRLASTSA